MNPDGQKFHLLLGLGDWGACAVPGDPPLDLAGAMALEPADRPALAPEWDGARQEVTLANRLDRLRGSASDVPLDLSLRRAAAADANGNIYWIGDDPAQLYVRSAGDGATTRFWPDPRSRPPKPGLFVDAAAGDPVPHAYHAMAVTDDSWLVVADATGLDSFDLIAGGPPARFDWPSSFSPKPVDLASRGRGLWLLDRDARRLYELDSTFSVCGGTGADPEPDLFQPETGEPRLHRPPAQAQGHDLTALDPAIDPIAIAPLSDGVVAILSRAPSAIFVLRTGDEVLLDRQPLEFMPHDMVTGMLLLRGGEEARRVLVSGRGGNQLRSFRIDGEAGAETLFATTETVPLRRHGGRALLTVEGAASYDSGPVPDWPRAVEQPRQLFATEGELATRLFDAGVPQTVWDRMRFDGCMPAGTHLLVEARCGDTPDRLGGWVRQPEPLLSRTGSELPAHGPAALPATDLKRRRGTFDLLLQQMRGRYLQLRLTLSGDGNTSPHLRALRVSWPRISWAERYLPAVWRADPAGADFLDRFLANMQGTISGIETRIAIAEALLDTRTTPKDGLGWLASWFDVALDPSWGEARSRAFIAHAYRFFGWRGTIRGLESALALAFGDPLDATLFDDGGCTCATPIRIVETYLTRTPVVAGTPNYAAGLAERARWVAFQQGLGRTAPMTTLPRLGVLETQAEDWAAFCERASPAREGWQRLLAGRYRRIAALNGAHGTAWTGFGEIALCDTAPATPAALADWTALEQHLTPIRDAAHRFTVLLPVKPSDPTDTASLGRLEALARRIIELEKPAHTIFDIRFYFAANRIGEARLGLDTAIGDGSRAAELLPPAILGRAYAGESFVGAGLPPLSPGRELLAC
ncbi:phage tail protein [Sphingomonas sp. dw_22]|uniref:phage tail protein n=1 Tax=Sphingomonas sp. dw_22 TaxID=2721175 RepID=UPI001BD43DB7|nr:phage tail protein [Sphingomonas sp. dw_22]